MDASSPPIPPLNNGRFSPVYRAFAGERWHIRHADCVLCPGYWTGPRLVFGMAALLRAHADGWQTWMSLSPMELESQELGCRHASGHVVVMGLGMGWAAANAALCPSVSRVTVVEHDPEVISLIKELGIFEQLPALAAPITIVAGDAYTFAPGRAVDTVLADIWHPLFGADRDADVWRMPVCREAKRVYFWGQELTLAQRARQRGWALDATTIVRLAEETGLPLIGPQEREDYAQLVRLAAERWLPKG